MKRVKLLRPILWLRIAISAEKIIFWLLVFVFGMTMLNLGQPVDEPIVQMEVIE